MSNVITSNNKKYLKRNKKNQLNEEKYYYDSFSMTSDGHFTLAIPIPEFVSNTTNCLLLLSTAAGVADFMERENIETIEQWNIMGDSVDFQRKVFNTMMWNHYSICNKYNVDMVGSAPTLLQSVEELMEFNRKWCDNFITPKTHFKYEMLPILEVVVKMIKRNIKSTAPLLVKHSSEKRAS